MNVENEALFLRASGNLLKLAVALLLSGAVLAYFGFIHFGTEACEHGGVRLALRIGTGILLYGGLKAALIRQALSKSLSS
ncbi:MAG: hypothetical protein V3R71_04250 [Gemmatimonadales bacterium]